MSKITENVLKQTVAQHSRWLSGEGGVRAVLRGADLAGAGLAGAVLRGADLAGANLTGANLAGADLTGADLTPIRDDLWAVLSAAPAEAAGLRGALTEGRVNGSTYEGDCACLVGTLANVRGVKYTDMSDLAPDSSRPAERFFLGIRKGDTPETSQFSRLAMEWVDAWIANMRAAFGSKTSRQEDAAPRPAPEVPAGDDPFADAQTILKGEG
jgi:uncharacterized protein YjbI with pentapeptide repeats